MMRNQSLLTVVVAWASLSLAGRALAAPGLFQIADAEGKYLDDANFIINTHSGQSFLTGDGSSYQYVPCVSSQAGGTCAAVLNPPPPPNSWYALPNPSSASAQVRTPDFGLNRVRTWSSGIDGVNSGAPGYTSYSSLADSVWREEITTTSAVPVVITFVVALNVDWNDGGLWAFQMGRPGIFDPDLGFAGMGGHTWSNCAVQSVSGLCTFAYYTGDALTVLPGGSDGAARIVVMQPFTVLPDSFGDPEDPNPFTNPFEAVLGARAHANDAEVLAYPGARLLAIYAPPGANLTFASGHTYNVVVPEPTAALSIPSGIALLALMRRRRPGSLYSGAAVIGA